MFKEASDPEALLYEIGLLRHRVTVAERLLETQSVIINELGRRVLAEPALVSAADLPRSLGIYVREYLGALADFKENIG